MEPLILIVEDEPKLAEVLIQYLQKNNYRTHWIDEGLSAVDWVKENQPDLVLLDLMLPGKDGMEICREIRQFSQLPVLMTTAKVEEIDRLLGLELGADDYICKPYSPREVIARVKAVLRRVHMSPEPEHQLQLDPHRFQVSWQGESLILTTVEFHLIEKLAKEPGRIFSRQQLMDSIYNDHRVVSDRTIDSHIKKLRRKLDAITAGKELIRSVYGAGYKVEYPE